MLLPRFVPILTSFATRVSGRELPTLLDSGAALARALIDTQKIVGHDGVLCLFHPPALAQSCIDSAGGKPRLREAEEVPRSAAIGAIIEGVRALRQQLSPRIGVFAAFAAPRLLLSGLDGTEADEDYVEDVFLGVVRAAFEAKANGIALIESGVGGMEPDIDLEALYRSSFRLAEFHDGCQMVFHLPGSADNGSIPAHCVFFLEAGDPCRALPGVAKLGALTPVSTQGDVTADTAPERLRQLCESIPGVAT